jgi:exonuclease III
MKTETKQRHSETNRSYESNGLTDIYRTFHPKAKEYTFFSAPHSTFSKIDHIIDHKTGLNRYKKIEIIPCTLSDHHRLRLVLNNNKNNGKHTYT